MSLQGSLVEVESLPASICVDDLIIALRELRELAVATQADKPVNPATLRCSIVDPAELLRWGSCWSMLLCGSN